MRPDCRAVQPKCGPSRFIGRSERRPRGHGCRSKSVSTPEVCRSLNPAGVSSRRLHPISWRGQDRDTRADQCGAAVCELLRLRLLRPALHPSTTVIRIHQTGISMLRPVSSVSSGSYRRSTAGRRPRCTRSSEPHGARGLDQGKARETRASSVARAIKMRSVSSVIMPNVPSEPKNRLRTSGPTDHRGNACVMITWPSPRTTVSPSRSSSMPP